MRAWLILVMSLIATAPCQAAVEAVNIYEPRAFGYFIGDTFERRIEVITSADTELLRAGLPRPGPLTYWLELTGVDEKMRESNGRKIYDVTLKYQTFYAAIQPVKVKIPAYPLKFRNSKLAPAPTETQPPAPEKQQPATPSADGKNENGELATPPSDNIATIPAFEIVMSPVREYAVSDFMSGKSTELSEVMAPDAQAHAISTSRATQWLAASLAALATSIVLLLWHYAKGPFARRAGRPFTYAERRIRDLHPGNGDEATYKGSLITLHRAFDEAYGRRVFAEDVPAFLAQNPHFLRLRDKLQQFFDTSRLFFFSGDREAAKSRFPIENVQQLAADLAREERAAA